MGKAATYNPLWAPGLAVPLPIQFSASVSVKAAGDG